MIFSLNKMFSDKQAVTATGLSTNVIDLGTPGTPYGAANPLDADIGKGIPMPILIQVTENFNNCTSVTVTLENSANSNMTSSTVLASETIVLADLLAGKQTFMQYVPNGADERYLGVRYTVAGTAPTTGQFTAGITMGNQTNA